MRINNENYLSGVLCITYSGALQYYFKPIREMPTGQGFADLVFIPRKKFSEKPALVVELKWDKSVEGAIEQIKKKEYCHSLKEYHGNLLLVGVNYDKKTKEHECVIEEFRKE